MVSLSVLDIWSEAVTGVRGSDRNENQGRISTRGTNLEAVRDSERQREAARGSEEIARGNERQ